jgi:hypothetical protein
MAENYELIRELANQDVDQLQIKGKTYGRSWLKRGGVGAFMMLARKWDRIENISQEKSYDIIEAGSTNYGDILDDISDLRCYLLLVECEIRKRIGENNNQEVADDGSEPGQGYVNQD